MDKNAFLVSAKGGILHATSPEGEVVFSVAVPPGKVAAAEFLDLLPFGAEYRVEGCTVVTPRALVSVVQHPDMLESGANPDFQPTLASANEVMLRQMIGQVAMMNDNLSKKLAALDKVEVMPPAPALPVEEDSAGAVLE